MLLCIPRNLTENFSITKPCSCIRQRPDINYDQSLRVNYGKIEKAEFSASFVNFHHSNRIQLQVALEKQDEALDTGVLYHPYHLK